MSVGQALAEIARGRRPADDGLLGSARFEWGGGEAYGEEAVLASFRASPLAIDGGVIEGRQAAAWLGEDAALFADLYDGRVGRLWRVGAGTPPAPEPAVSVAIDTDLRQRRGDVSLRRADHPELTAPAAERLIEAARALIETYDPSIHRARAFVLRAFTAGDTPAALIALHRLGAGSPRTSGFVGALVVIDGGGTARSVIDQPPRPDWTPRL